MNKHTPGPWKVQKPDHFVDGLSHFVVSDHPSVSYFHIAEMGTHDGREQAAANARLIAAAPEMLEALELINGYCHAGMMSNELGKHVKLEQIADICRDLIQKAEV